MVDNVGQLIAELQKLDPELPLAVSSDEEGNNIRILHGVDEDLVTELRYNYMETVHPDDIEEWQEENGYLPLIPIAVIW